MEFYYILIVTLVACQLIQVPISVPASQACIADSTHFMETQ